jgi:hypothetical protein
MKTKDAGRANEGNRATTPSALRKLNTLTASLGRVGVGGVPVFDPEDYTVAVCSDGVIYNQYIIAEALAALDTLTRILGPGVRKVILDYAEAKDIIARSMTTRRAKAKPRLKWEKDRREGENPAQFAWRAYAVEAAAGILHRGLIHTENPELHRRLNSWLRSHPLPEGIDIPTKPEWHTRQLAKLSRPLRPRVSIEEGRLYDIARKRRRRGAPSKDLTIVPKPG